VLVNVELRLIVHYVFGREVGTVFLNKKKLAKMRESFLKKTKIFLAGVFFKEWD
jgi:hypothetical protein